MAMFKVNVYEMITIA